MLFFNRIKENKRVELGYEDVNQKNPFPYLEKEVSSINFDYMQYFRDKDNGSHQISEGVENNLKKYSEEDLQKLAVDILSMSFGKLRGLASEPMPPGNNLLQAIVWYLSDAVHNLPPRINNYNDSLPSHLSEFFVFVYFLDKIEIDEMQWLKKYQYR
jgi:hypothetical protein